MLAKRSQETLSSEKKNDQYLVNFYQIICPVKTIIDASPKSGSDSDFKIVYSFSCHIDEFLDSPQKKLNVHHPSSKLNHQSKQKQRHQLRKPVIKSRILQSRITEDYGEATKYFVLTGFQECNEIKSLEYKIEKLGGTVSNIKFFCSTCKLTLYQV